MNARLFWKSLVVQAVAVAIPFAILGAALDRDFFEDWGWAVGPVVLVRQLRPGRGSRGAAGVGGGAGGEAKRGEVAPAGVEPALRG